LRKAAVVAATAAILAMPAIVGPASADSRPAWKTGTSGDDKILGTNCPDRVRALGGDDFVNARGGSDVVLGGAGDDGAASGSHKALYGDSPYMRADSAKDGDDVIRGHGGDDSLYGFGGDDRLLGGGGDDEISAQENRYDLAGGGSGTLSRNPGRDIVRGGPGDDLIFAKDGRKDRVDCGDGRDTVFFDRGLDTIAPGCERKNPSGGI
jgi:Ca2+-binding RTX toxin-like protein